MSQATFVRITFLSLAALLFWNSIPSWADDEVRMKNGQTLRGELIRYDERGIELRMDRGRVLSYPMSKVAKVNAVFSDAHQLAETALQARRYGEAVQQLRRARERENRAWALARIEASLVRALTADGNLAEAGDTFLLVLADRKDSEVMALAPLIWLPGVTPNAEATAKAREWLHDERPTVRLIAASWLLATADGDLARRYLEQLMTDPQQRVSWLARSQLWRVLDETDLGEIERFRALIEKMPEVLRGGPQLVLGQAYQKAGKNVDAALAYLWIPFVYAPDSDLAAEATLRAAQCSQAAGLSPDAEKLFREVITKHPDTTWATTAQAQLDQVTSPKSSPAERN